MLPMDNSALPPLERAPVLPAWFALACLLALPIDADRADTAFYYGSHPPVAELGHYDRVVVEPSVVTSAELDALQVNSRVLAYLSIGEVHPDRPWAESIDPAWVLGENPTWKSQVIDPTATGWQSFLVEERACELAARGFDGFFLDTLDSFHAFSSDPAVHTARAKAIAKIILDLREAYPDAKIVLNRGFELLDRVGDAVSGVVAESLYTDWDFENARSRRASSETYEWLLTQLERAHDEFALPVTVIDYTRDRDDARRLAREIAAHGFTPWITTPSLTSLGIGAIEVVPRRVLALYDSGDDAKKGTPADRLAIHPVHACAATVAEYLGYAVDYHDVRRSLPPRDLSRYAGVMAWFSDTPPNRRELSAWFEKTIEEGTRVAFFGRLTTFASPKLLTKLGVNRTSGRLTRPVTLDAHAGWSDFETAAKPRSRGVEPLRASRDDVVPRLSVTDANGQRLDAVITAPWGGAALAPYVLRIDIDQQAEWVVNPFEFLASALALPPIPTPDITTAYGSRLLFAHIDGDGAVSRGEWYGAPYAIEVVLDRIIRRYALPITVSVIEGETGAAGLYPQLSSEMERIAREIFALPYVEAATHTYSHPFNWSRAEHSPCDHSVRLPIEDYAYDVQREVLGSTEYVARLLPEGRSVETILWSGNALPTAAALAAAKGIGLGNLNGGNTCVTRDHPSITHVSPIARPIGEYLHVYAPITNENVYTNDWTGPFYGFRRVIETFELTERPRRLKPLNIYYHFYSGCKVSSLRALEDVYDWTLTQETRPIHVSEYLALARAFQEVSIARTLDGEWRFSGGDALRTFRIPAELGWPALTDDSVHAFHTSDVGRFVTLDQHRRLTLQASPSVAAGISRTNGTVVRLERGPSSLRFRIAAHVPVEVTIAAPVGGALYEGDREIEAREVIDGPTEAIKLYRYAFEGSATGELVFRTPRS